MSAINNKLCELIAKHDADNVKTLLKRYKENPFEFEHLEIDQALCQCIESKCVELTRVFLSAKASIRCVTSSGARPIHLACIAGNTDIVDLLIKEGAILNMADTNGFYPLHLAVKEGHYNVVELLIKSGASLNRQIFRNSNESALHLAIQRSNHMMASLLIDKGADVNIKSKGEDTPLHYAAKRGLVRTAQYLLVHNADVNVQNNEGVTPLMCAIRKTNPTLVSLLLENGSDINSRDWNGCNVVCYLLEGLSTILSPDNFDELKVFAVDFLQSNSHLVNDFNLLGFHPLHHAIDYLLLSVVKVVVEGGADVNLEDKRDKQTPLGWAVRLGALEIACYLVDQGADVRRTVQQNSSNFLLWNILIKTQGLY